MRSDILTLTGCFIASTLAHGGVYTYDIDGKKYDGNPIRIPTLVANMSRDSIQRRWWYYPNYDMTSPNTTCGYDGGVAYSEFKATLHAPVEAGKTITAYYDTADFDPNYQRGLEYEVPVWPHTDGPLQTYMARCPGDSCVGWEPTGNVWFKVNEYGLEDGLVAENFTAKWQTDPSTNVNYTYYDNVWQQYRRIFGRRHQYGYENGNQTGIPTTIPSSLLPGKYLLRTEVLYFYTADKSADPPLPAGYQLYHNCAQLDVSGKGDRLPEKESLVAFPGAYKPGDEAFLWYNERYPEPYRFPGPKVWNGE